MKNRLLFRERLYLESPGKHSAIAHLGSRILFRWLSGHRSLRAWVVGTGKWAIIVVNDGCDSKPIMTAETAARRIQEGID